jgi:tRNA-dihydrouridine synthase
MIGQGAIGNPRVFTPHQPTMSEKLETILRHLDLSVACDQYFEQNFEQILLPTDRLAQKIQTNLQNPDFAPHSIVEFRKFLFQYIKGIPESREWKVEMLQVKQYGEVRELIQKFFAPFC